MTCPHAQEWDLLAMEALDQKKAENLLLHAESCDSCREQLASARRVHIDCVRMYEAFDRGHDELREQLLADLPDEIPRHADTGVIIRLRDRLGDLAMTLKTTRNRRLAAVLLPAACILLAVGLVLILGHGTIAFASVQERMRQARTMVCDLTTVTVTVFEPEHRTEERTYHQKLSMYSDGAAYVGRIDQTDPPSTQWVFPDHLVKIDAEGKQTVIRFAEQVVPRTLYESPAWWHDRLLKLTEAPDRTLGIESLDGRKVVGFEIAGWKLGYGARPTPGDDGMTAPTAAVRLWVDASTRLPVRMDIEQVMATQMPGIFSMRVSQTWEHIEYEVPLDHRSFEPPPAAASQPVEEESLTLPAASEDSFLDGLRAYPQQIKALFGERFVENLSQLMEQQQPDDPGATQARALLADIRELVGHGYPPQIDPSFLGSVMLKVSILVPSLERAREIAARARGDTEALARLADEREAAAGNGEAAARLAEKRELDRKELERKLKELSCSVMAIEQFYQQLLVGDGEPEYFGATVKPGEASAVLVKWRLEDGRRRVIYGDLRVETLPAVPPAGDPAPNAGDE